MLRNYVFVCLFVCLFGSSKESLQFKYLNDVIIIQTDGVFRIA